MSLRIPAILLLATLILVPSSASAATKKTSCTLVVTTPDGETKITKEDTVRIDAGDEVTIEWDSKNATKATLNKKTVDVDGEDTFSPDKTTTYTYVFGSGSKKATCAVTLAAVSASITQKSLGEKDKKISGNADGTKTVKVAIKKEGKTVFTSKSLKVKSDKWSTTLKKALPKGTYDVTITGDKGLGVLATSTLRVGVPANTGTVSASLIPLLMGGTARANATVPVFYLKLVNNGKEEATINGISVKQNGSTPVQAIANVSIIDEHGGSFGSTSAFNNGTAYIPTTAVLAPGELRLFTLKATMAGNASSYLGTQLMIDVTGIDAGAGVKGMFPIRGTTFTVGY